MGMKEYAQIHPKAYAYNKVIKQWHSKREYNCLVDMWTQESHWNPKAHNHSTGAYGIAQFLPATWGNYKMPYKPVWASVQITAGLRYITVRYGSPCRAWAFWQKHYWY